jgi:hypothetical protein
VERAKEKEFIADDLISKLTLDKFETKPTFLAVLASGWSIECTTVIDFT